MGTYITEPVWWACPWSRPRRSFPWVVCKPNPKTGFRCFVGVRRPHKHRVDRRENGENSALGEVKLIGLASHESMESEDPTLLNNTSYLWRRTPYAGFQFPLFNRCLLHRGRFWCGMAMSHTLSPNGFCFYLFNWGQNKVLTYHMLPG